MTIKKGVIFNKSKGCYEGFVDLGENIVACGEDDTVAAEAMIFMISALHSYWKYPIGYVLINKINANNLYCLISRAPQLSLDNNLKVPTVTCDGTATNFKSMKLLGCKIGENLNEIDGTFTIPGYSYDIFFTPDACHMLKLARNALSDLKVLLDENDDPVQWKYIHHLHEEQLEERLKFGNKLSNAHIAFHRHKMNVRIEATIRFIRIIDKLFDLLNSRSPRSSGYKSPLRIINRCIWEDTVDSRVHYLAGLNDTNGVSLLHHRRKTFVTGLILISTSTKN